MTDFAYRDYFYYKHNFPNTLYLIEKLTMWHDKPTIDKLSTIDMRDIAANIIADQKCDLTIYTGNDLDGEQLALKFSSFIAGEDISDMEAYRDAVIKGVILQYQETIEDIFYAIKDHQTDRFHDEQINKMCKIRYYNEHKIVDDRERRDDINSCDRRWG